MPLDPVDELVSRLTARNGAWPPRAFDAAWREVRTWRAFLETDRPALARIAGWDDGGDRPYRVDPLGERIAETWSDHSYGDDPVIHAGVATVEPGEEGEDGEPAEPGRAGDTENMDRIVEENDLPDELRTADQIRVGEGEVWWRIAVDADASPDAPLIEFHSRGSVAPIFVGRRLVAAALITILEGRGHDDGGARPVYRHFEVHTDGRVEHLLFRGAKRTLGDEVDLETHPETEELEPVWEHGLPMLMGRVLNRRGRSILLGRSDFHRIKDFLLELNEAVVIGWENMRLTAKKRAVMPASAVEQANATVNPDSIDRGDGIRIPITEDSTLRTPATVARRANLGDDVFVTDPLDEDLGKDPGGVFKVLEYAFDAEALVTHKRDLVETAATRVGLTPQWLGIHAGAEGYAITGTAARFRLITTDKAGRGKLRPWRKTLPHLLRLAALVDSMSEEDGGLGNDWVDAEALPAVEFAPSLPPDEVEEATIDSTLVTAGVASRRSRIKARHKDWTDAQVDAELELIKGDKAAGGSLLGGLA